MCHAARVSFFALLVVALGTGVPVRGHTHHHETETQVGAQGHGHGMVLVQQDMRIEPAGAQHFVTRASATVYAQQRLTRGFEGPLSCDDDVCDSRAPPTARPRAPPL